MSVHNHPPYRPMCNERDVAGQLRGACLNDDGTPRRPTMSHDHRAELDSIRQRITDQTAHLRAHGFSEAFTSGGTFGGISLTSCLTCGSVVALTPVVEGQAHPLDLHKAWHRTCGAKGADDE